MEREFEMKVLIEKQAWEAHGFASLSVFLSLPVR